MYSNIILPTKKITGTKHEKISILKNNCITQQSKRILLIIYLKGVPKFKIL